MSRSPISPGEPRPGNPPTTPILTSRQLFPPIRRSISLRKNSALAQSTSASPILPNRGEPGALFEEGAYAWLPDAEDVFIPVRVQKPFRQGEKGQVVRLRPNESSFHNEEELNRKRRLSIGSRQRHHLRLSVTVAELSPFETVDLVRADETSLIPTANMIDMVDLSEATLLHNLRLRFFEKRVYTSIGTILVSVNPFEALPIYTPEIVEMYRQAGSHLNRAKLGPHVYGLAHDAFSSMIDHRQDQSCIVTGESGSGKTEFTKLFLQYLMELSRAENEDEDRLPNVNEDEVVNIDENDNIDPADAVSTARDIDDDGEDFSRLALSTRILTANPLLEAFGNAVTVRNDNSSRFGKWVAVAFHKKKGSVLGATVQVYLLEKSRLVHRGPNERNFHVFYQMLAGAESDPYLRESLQLDGGVDSFRYLSENAAGTTEGVQPPTPVMPDAAASSKSMHDSRSWAQTLRSLRSIGVSREQEGQLLQVLAGLLHLGNVEFEERIDGSSAVTTKDVLDVASELLGLEAAQLETSLTKKDVSNNKERLFQNRNATQAREARDSLAKFIYAKLFDWVVIRINTALGVLDRAQLISHSTIGMLDVFGFEVFERNSFEQLCINYANEKLQEHFNRKVFEMERDEYLAQGMGRKEVDELFRHVSNVECLALFEEKPLGIFAALEDEIFIPRGTDGGFVTKVSNRAKRQSSGLVKEATFTKVDATRFRIFHYAGIVEYDATSFLEKSRDRIDPVLEQLSARSVRPLLVQMVGGGTAGQSSVPSPSSGSTPSGGGKRKEQKSLGTKFVSQLGELIDALDTTEPHYARCIKPNEMKSGSVFRAQMVMDQLRYAGLLDVCRVRKRGYPIRLDFEEFSWRYGNTLFAPSQVVIGDDSPRSKCLAILAACGSENGDAFVGTSKVLLRHSLYDELEVKRDEALKQRATIIQKLARGRLSRVSIAELKSALTRLAQITGNPNFSEQHLKELDAQLIACRDVPSSHPIISAALAAKKKVESRALVLEMIAKVSTVAEAIIAKKEALAVGIPPNDPCLSGVNELLQRKSEFSQIKSEIETAMETRDLFKLEKALVEYTVLEGTYQNQVDRLRTPSFTQEKVADARTLRDRLLKEKEAIDTVDKAIADDVSVERLKAALKIMLTLGMEKHPTAVAASKLLKKKKRKENESRDLTMLRAKGTEDIKQTLSKLKLAESAKDLKALAEARHEAIELGIDRVPDVQRAARLIQQLEDENDLETSLAAATEFVQAKANLKSGTGLSFQDIERLVEAIAVAKQRGVPTSSVQLMRAVETETTCRLRLKVQNGLEEGMKERDYNKVNSALLDAVKLNMDNDLVRRARAVSSRRSDNGSRIGRTISLQDRAQEIKRISQTDFERRRIQRLSEARNPKNDWWNLEDQGMLRPDEDFGSKVGAFLSLSVNKKVAKSKWKYSGKVIPKSLTVSCGKDERVAKRAVLMNKAILGFCGDLVLPFPTVLVQQIMEAALLDLPLADELWVQLLRQLTENPYEDSERRAWMLCAICSSCLGPTAVEIENAVLHFLIVQSRDASGLDPINREYARYALRQFEKTVLEGPSGVIPSQDEIAAFQERPPMLATVSLPDGSELVREYPVAPDVTVHDLVEACCATYNIRTDLSFQFGLFVEVKAEDVGHRRSGKLKRLEIAGKLESATSPTNLLPVPPPGPAPSGAAAAAPSRKVTFADEPEKSTSVIRRVSASMMTLKKKASLSSTSERVKNNLSTKSFGGIISEEDALEISEEEEKAIFPRSRSMGSKNMGSRTASGKITFAPSKSRLRHTQMPPKVPEPLPNTEYLGDVFTHYLGHGERLQFIFRRKLVTPLGKEPPGALKERQFVEVCFLEAVHEVLQGNWACQTKEEVADLAALMLSEARGGKAPQVISSAMTNAIQEFIPITWRGRLGLSNQDWARLITSAAQKMKVTSGKETRRAFLNRVGQLPTYGTICFPIRQTSSEQLILACGPRGLLLLKDDTTRAEVLHIPHLRLRQMGAFAQSVFVDVWDEQHTKVKERLTFITSQGHEIAALLWELSIKFS